jgi:hypothetical protein
MPRRRQRVGVAQGHAANKKDDCGGNILLQIHIEPTRLGSILNKSACRAMQESAW